MANTTIRRGALLAVCVLGGSRTAICQGPILSISGVGNGLNFSAPADQPLTPYVTLPQIVNVDSNVPNLPFVLSEAYVVGAKAGTPSFVTVSPTSGVTPANVSISLNPNVVPFLAPGIYTMSLAFKSTDPALPGGSGFNVSLSQRFSRASRN